MTTEEFNWAKKFAPRDGLEAATSSPTLLHRRYGSYTSEDSTEIAVKVRAADFNGETFDGRPFSAVPDWLMEAVRNCEVMPHTRGSTDYAEWDVVTKVGIVSASPGDWIIRRERGDLSVVSEEDASILINLRPPVGGEHDRGR